jgi:hypothetical protein
MKMTPALLTTVNLRFAPLVDESPGMKMYWRVWTVCVTAHPGFAIAGSVRVRRFEVARPARTRWAIRVQFDKHPDHPSARVATRDEPLIDQLYLGQLSDGQSTSGGALHRSVRQ